MPFNQKVHAPIIALVCYTVPLSEPGWFTDTVHIDLGVAYDTGSDGVLSSRLSSEIIVH